MATTTKVNMFAKAKGRVAADPVARNAKETVWAITPIIKDPPTIKQLNEAVSKMISLAAERKTIETKEKVYKKVLEAFATERYIDYLTSTGAQPPTPLKVINEKAESVTYVVQDRAHLVKVPDGELAALTKLFGVSAVKSIVGEFGEFSFNPAIMTMAAPTPPDGDPEEARTVQDVVAEAISETLVALQEAGKLTEDQVGGLLTYKSERRFKPGLVPRIVDVCGKDCDKITAFLELVGSAITKYVRA